MDFNAYILSHIQMSRGTPVYTIHAEVEGIAFHQNFDELLIRAADMGMTFARLASCYQTISARCQQGRSCGEKYRAERDGSAANNR